MYIPEKYLLSQDFFTLQINYRTKTFIFRLKLLHRFNGFIVHLICSSSTSEQLSKLGTSPPEISSPSKNSSKLSKHIIFMLNTKYHQKNV